MPIAVLSEYTEKEYEPFDPYSRFYPAMPISVCFSDTALYTLGKWARGFSCAGFCRGLGFSAGGRGIIKTEKRSGRHLLKS